jgi:hypothetical protein
VRERRGEAGGENILYAHTCVRGVYAFVAMGRDRRSQNKLSVKLWEIPSRRSKWDTFGGRECSEMGNASLRSIASSYSFQSNLTPSTKLGMHPSLDISSSPLHADL